MPKERRLTEINPREVSFVDKAANKRKFLVTKSSHPTTDNSDDTNSSNLFSKRFNISMTLPQIMRFTRFMDEEESESFFSNIEKSSAIKDLASGLLELDGNILKKSLIPLSKSKDTKELISVLKTDLPGDFMSQRVDNFEADLNKLGKEALEVLRTMVNMLNDFFNRGVKPGDSTFIEDATMVEKNIKEEIEKLPEHIQKFITGLSDENVNTKKSLDEANATITKSKNKSNDEDPLSGLSDIQKAHFKKQDAKLALLEKAADQFETNNFIAKAESLKLPEVKVDAFGLALKELSQKCSKDTSELIMKALTDAGEAISKSNMLKPIGADGEPTMSDNETKLDRAVKEIQKSEKCTYPMAVNKALDQNPELYE